jgi:hypothetical protein
VDAIPLDSVGEALRPVHHIGWDYDYVAFNAMPRAFFCYHSRGSRIEKNQFMIVEESVGFYKVFRTEAVPHEANARIYFLTPFQFFFPHRNLRFSLRSQVISGRAELVALFVLFRIKRARNQYFILLRFRRIATIVPRLREI